MKAGGRRAAGEHGGRGSFPSFFDVTVVEPGDDRGRRRRTLLQDNEVDVAFVTGSAPVVALVDGSNLFAAQSIVVGAQQGRATRCTTQVLYNPELKTSWVMVPAIIGLILTFIGTIITSIGLVRERETGTLEQLAVMPIKPSTVILGKITPYFLVASLDMVIVTVLGMLLFDVPFNGNPFVFALGAGAVPVRGARARGVHLDDLADAGQAIQTAFFFLLPQILLSGHDLPARRDGGRGALDRLPAAADLLHDDLARASCCAARPLASLWLPFLVLTVMAVVVFTGATLRFRRDLAPGRRRTVGASRARGAQRRARRRGAP